jgi:diaminopimelate epimerase
MRSVRAIPFAKTEAHGNDFLLVSEEELPLARSEEGARIARAVCHRLSGVGADGLIVYRAKEGVLAMTLYNSDGSAAEISGNGVRGLAAYLVYRGRLEGEAVEIETEAGKLSLQALKRDGNRLSFRANMGSPRIEAIGTTLEVDGESLEATTLSMGNPHCVLFTARFDAAELRRIGPKLESHPRFPRKTNVELVEVVSENAVRMGIWERGVGETASSGTGSTASAVAAIANGRAVSPVSVHCPGGAMQVEWDGKGDAFLTGEAVVVAEGTYLYY